MISQYFLLFFLLFCAAILLFGISWTLKLTRSLPSHLEDFYDGEYNIERKFKLFQLMR